MSADRPATILVVSRQPAQLQRWCDLLTNEGHATAGFTSATEALAAFRSQPRDLVLTEMQLPELDGLSLLRTAKEIDAHVAGIVLTNDAELEAVAEATRAAGLDCLVKPLEGRALLPAVTRGLEMRQLRAEKA